jgi:hypothetical protein
MCLTFLLSSTLHRPEDLFLRLQAVVDESTSLRGVDCDGPEGGFASAWQLAVTLAGNPSIDILAEKSAGKSCLALFATDDSSIDLGRMAHCAHFVASQLSNLDERLAQSEPDIPHDQMKREASGSSIEFVTLSHKLKCNGPT